MGEAIGKRNVPVLITREPFRAVLDSIRSCSACKLNEQNYLRNFCISLRFVDLLARLRVLLREMFARLSRLTRNFILSGPDEILQRDCDPFPSHSSSNARQYIIISRGTFMHASGGLCFTMITRFSRWCNFSFSLLFCISSSAVCPPRSDWKWKYST